MAAVNPRSANLIFFLADCNSDEAGISKKIDVFTVASTKCLLVWHRPGLISRSCFIVPEEVRKKTPDTKKAISQVYAKSRTSLLYRVPGEVYCGFPTKCGRLRKGCEISRILTSACSKRGFRETYSRPVCGEVPDIGKPNSKSACNARGQPCRRLKFEAFWKQCRTACAPAYKPRVGIQNIKETGCTFLIT
jgi:hypothetical protein